MNNKVFLISMIVFITCIIISIVSLRNDYLLSFSKENKTDLVFEKYDFIENTEFSYHNTSVRNKKIEYIVIHYTGLPVEAIGFLDYFNRKTSLHSSADYFVEIDGTIYQYNMEIEKRYSWAVGDEKNETLGGKLYGKVTNENSISIEMCVDSSSNLEANDINWKLSGETIESTKILVNKLMKQYNISEENVIRHYDVSGKLCPGIVGWNLDSGSEEEWIKFKIKLGVL